MIKLSNSKILSIASLLLILVLVAKSLSLLLMWFLPSEGVSLHIKPNLQPKYQRVDFKNMLTPQVKKAQVKQVTTSNSGISITNMVLKGLYGTKTSGFIIVALKATPKKTTILSVGEVFSGYKLKEIDSNSAIFTRDGTLFTLLLENAKKSAAMVKQSKQKRSVSDDEPIMQQVVTRGDIAYYAKHPKQIWKEISIREVRDGKKIKGFKVTRIAPNSKFATIGLKKGDLIIKANNVELKSYRDALNIYAKIDKIDVVQIVIIRNGVEKEIVYEIN